MKDRDNFALWVQYKKARNNFTLAIRKSKRKAWQSFTERATNLEDMLKVSKTILQQKTEDGI